MRAPVQHDRAADGSRIAAEAGLPGHVGEHGHERPAADRRLVVREQPAGRGVSTEQAKGIGGDEATDHSVGPAGARVVHGLDPNDPDVRERPVAGAPFLKIGQADEVLVLITGGGPEHEESPGVRIRQRPEQYRAHRAVDSRVGGDGENQREDGDGGESGRPAELAQRKGDVLPQLGQVFRAPNTPLVLEPELSAGSVDRGAISEAKECLRPRRLGTQPLLDQLAGEHLQVKVELGVDLVGDGGPPEPGPELSPEPTDSGHVLRPAAGWGRRPR